MNSQTEQPMTWSIAGHSVIGASHVRHDLPNQDAIVWSGDPVGAAVLAVSDGHGSSRHFRSKDGSRIAVDVAVEVLSQEAAWIGTPAASRQPDALVAGIIAAWRARVLDHAARNPMPEGSSGDEEEILLAYGATLIAAAVSASETVVLQLGDGDLLLGRSDGTILRPLPDDEGLVGEQTYSLCLPDAPERTRVRALPHAAPEIDFIMLSTDGLSKSFADPRAFVNLAGSWRKAIREQGLSSVVNGLDEWLSSTSREGSGDDITVGFMVRAGAPPQTATVAPPAAAGRPDVGADVPRAHASATAPSPHAGAGRFLPILIAFLVGLIIAGAGFMYWRGHQRPPDRSQMGGSHGHDLRLHDGTRPANGRVMPAENRAEPAENRAEILPEESSRTIRGLRR